MPVTPITPAATFELQSGHLCYGALHNIHHGASAPKSEHLPDLQEAVPGGTIRRHEHSFNLPALKGTWHIYPLLGKYGEDIQIVAYLVSHSSVDPPSEVDKILRVAGSPYEYDSGSTFNDESTAREGVFVVNRYDWGWYDDRCSEDIQEPDLPFDLPYQFSAIGVVNQDRAMEFVERLKSQRADHRDMISEGIEGVWLVLKDAEYQFGRFGFDEEKKHARSFLFFGNHTDFTTTRFEGEGQQTLRKFETSVERFERSLRQDYDFSQRRLVETLFRDQKPGEDEMFGPYAPEEFLLSRADIDAVRDCLPHEQFGKDTFPNLRMNDAAVNQGLERWWSASVDLINDVLLSFLEYRIVPHLQEHTGENPQIAVPTLFPNDLSDLTNDLRKRFLGNENLPNTTAPDSEHVALKARMRTFVQTRGVTPDNDLLDGVCRLLAFIVKDVMELARNSAVDEERFAHIVPKDVFLVIVNDPSWYGHNLSRSRMLWSA